MSSASCSAAAIRPRSASDKRTSKVTLPSSWKIARLSASISTGLIDWISTSRFGSTWTSSPVGSKGDTSCQDESVPLRNLARPDLKPRRHVIGSGRGAKLWRKHNLTDRQRVIGQVAAQGPPGESGAKKQARGSDSTAGDDKCRLLRSVRRWFPGPSPLCPSMAMRSTRACLTVTRLAVSSVSWSNEPV